MTMYEIDKEDKTAEKNVPFPLRLWDEVYPKFGELYESLKKDNNLERISKVTLVNLIIKQALIDQNLKLKIPRKYVKKQEAKKRTSNRGK